MNTTDITPVRMEHHVAAGKRLCRYNEVPNQLNVNSSQGVLSRGAYSGKTLEGRAQVFSTLRHDAAETLC